MILHRHTEEGESQAGMIEDVKLSSAVQLLGVLTLGYQWTSKKEHELWVALMLYVEQRGNAKAVPGADITMPEGNA